MYCNASEREREVLCLYDSNMIVILFLYDSQNVAKSNPKTDRRLTLGVYCNASETEREGYCVYMIAVKPQEEHFAS